MVMARFMKESGDRTRLMARAFSLTLTDLDIKVSGVRTCKMDLALRPGQMGQFSRGITKRD